MPGPRTIEKAELALPHLVDYAKRGSAVTYKELGHKVDLHPRPLRYVLGYIRDEICVPKGLPLINSIVVNQDTRLPGESFLVDEAGPLTWEQYRQTVQAEQKRVFDYTAWDALLADLGLSPVS